MTKKSMPEVGSRVTVHEIQSVTWDGKNTGTGVSGYVTDTLDETFFYLLPDEPDPTVNIEGKTAREYRENIGWRISLGSKWEHWEFIIQEMP